MNARIVGFALLMASVCADAATITIVGGAGFNDPTPRAPVGGNTGTTLGQQRQILFQAAADVWAARLTSSQTIKVAAEFVDQECEQFSGQLGSAGPSGFFFIGSGAARRLIPVALAEARLNANINNTDVEIESSFNAKLDSAVPDPLCLGGERWYYGLTGSPPANSTALFPTILHELGHGLGFLTLVCEAPAGCGGGTIPHGGYFLDGTSTPIPDLWSEKLRDVSFNQFWINLTPAQRVTSFTNGPNLVWDGANVNAALGTLGISAGTTVGRVRMYAPNPFEGGSSISHWDTSVTPNLLMEPIATPDVFNQTDLTVAAFADIGWTVNAGGESPVLFANSFE